MQQYNKFNKVTKRIDTIFMDSINIKSPDPHRFLLNLRSKIGLTIKDKYVAIPNLSIHYTLKKYKKVIQKQ